MIGIQIICNSLLTYYCIVSLCNAKNIGLYTIEDRQISNSPFIYGFIGTKHIDLGLSLFSPFHNLFKKENRFCCKHFPINHARQQLWFGTYVAMNWRLQIKLKS